MRLGVRADGDRVSVVDLATGEAVDDVVRASVRASVDGVVASMTWLVTGSGETPDAAAGPALIGREAFLGTDRDDDDRPRPRRPL